MSMKKEILRGMEGMWPLNAVPRERIQKLLGTHLDDDFLLHAQRASARMNNGGSASFVSGDGLLATNHHVAESVLYELSDDRHDYLKNGYIAKTQKDEIKAPQLEVNVLWEIEDVTDRIKSELRKASSLKDRQRRRRAVIAKIEKESLDKTKMRSDVITLYKGGSYHLYRYKKYTDVRLVFAPEHAIAGYGGDADNFEYPRYCLDVTFFRVYEKGKPLQTPYHFKWSTDTLKLGKPLFVIGHPGSNTQRNTPLSRILYLRDRGIPEVLDYLRRLEVSLQQFAKRSPENARRSTDDLFGVVNTRKVYVNQLKALQSPSFIKDFAKREDSIRNLVAKNPALKKYSGNAWDQIEKASEHLEKVKDELRFFEHGRGFRSSLFGIARTIVRLIEEDKKDNAKRLPEFSDARRESLLESLYSPAPIYHDLEQHTFDDSLRLLVEKFGFKDNSVRQIIGDKSIEDVAREYTEQSKLYSVAERKRLVKGGMRAIKSSKDPFIKLVLLVDKRARDVREDVETNVETVMEDGYEKIAHALFELFGESAYPDSTFTLRLAYGTANQYEYERVSEQKFSTVKGIFPHGEKHNFEGDWKLPKSWESKKAILKKDSSVLNFLTNHDTTGGNSGSPVVTEELSIVGLLFDGLTHTQGDTYMFMDDSQDHTVCVHTQGIYSALKKVYKAQTLVKELETGHK